MKMVPPWWSMMLLLSSPAVSSGPAICEQSDGQKLTALHPKANDFFGFSLALSDNRLLVGAQGSADKGLSEYATVFVRKGDNWVSEAVLSAADGGAGDNFGGAVAIDADIAVIGARRHDAVAEDAGAAYLFARRGSDWQQLAKLTAENAAAGDEFGYSVAIDGDTLAIGAPRNDSVADDAGAVDIFEKANGQWRQTAVLSAPDGAAGDVFGISLSLSDSRLLVGADLTDQGGENAGSAYIFRREAGDWQFETKLTARDADAGDLFGIRVHLDGDLALIGAARDDERAENAGAAYIFRRTDREWQQEAKLIPPDGAANDRFGTRVAVSGDTLAVGSILHDGSVTDAGAVYVYQKKGGNWRVTRKLVASESAGEDVFGWGLTMNKNHIAVGAPGFIVTKPGIAGAAYVFDLKVLGCLEE
ncbi:FG-GAP repeat protein [Alterisphingorhabdus coralli]|uniref:Integrin n=1 Tax=Alterisphingorhabdus coralli TaxID=3071408 RepID=A0AA97F5I7_9SPHN|nr:hypothetical protein [Parasphingorhabdus sp. SCSIO 66989]WOE74591.1 hypothetical protein RB602_12145 [Parasphingorhabdus sp. SCSIO 66989]